MADPLLDSRRGWGVVATAFVAMFTVFGIAYSFGAFFKPMADEFDSSRSAISFVFAITAFVYFLLGVVSGSAVHRYGPRAVLLTGAAFMGGGLLLTSKVQSLLVGYLTYGVGVGVAVACGYVPMLAVVGGWFERRRSTALGVAVAGIGLGTLTVSPLAAELIDRYGWRQAYVVFGVAGALVLVLCAITIAPPPVHVGPPPVAIRAAVRDRTFRVLYLSSFLMSLALFQVFVFLVPFAEDHGVSKVGAASLLGIVGGASIAGRLGLSALADRAGRMRVYQASFLLMAASYAVWLVADGFAALVLFAVITGTGYGGFIALSPAVAADLFGTAGMGGIVGALYTSAAFGALVGPPLAGRLVDATGGYRWMIACALALALASWSVLRRIKPASPAPLRRAAPLPS